MPNHLNQSCFLQRTKSSGLHNTILPMQSFTCYYMSYHSFLSAFLEIKFPASLSSCILPLSHGTSTAVLILLHILTPIVFSSFFLYIFSWLTCENELNNRQTEVASSGRLRKTKDIKGSNKRVMRLWPPVHLNNYKPQIIFELCYNLPFQVHKGSNI